MLADLCKRTSAEIALADSEVLADLCKRPSAETGLVASVAMRDGVASGLEGTSFGALVGCLGCAWSWVDLGNTGLGGVADSKRCVTASIPAAALALFRTLFKDPLFRHASPVADC
jgi:hypothetical protein